MRYENKRKIAERPNRKRTPPPETSMIDLTSWEDNEKSNISSATSYSNSNTILSEMNEIPLIIEIESYANVLRQPVATVKKA